ncbi:MAG TPA: hypothetical protein VNS46_20775 [Nocardioides sp.]|nr:hypothetical protein [Nocardioides sp.]
MATTPRGIVYPDPSSQPRRQDLEDLAESTDAALPDISYQTGVVNLSGTAIASGGFVTAIVTFPTAFADPPAVTAVGAGFASGGAYLAVRAVDTVTATSCRVVVANYGDAAATFTNFPYRWIAIGPA